MTWPITGEIPELLTEDQIAELRRAVTGDAVDLRILAGRPAIFCRKTEEPLQFVTSGNPHVVKWLAAGWQRRIESERWKEGR